MNTPATPRDPEVLEVLHADALRSVAQQWVRIGEVRTRGAALVTAGAIAAGFLAPQVFGASSEVFDGRPTVFAWLAIAAFAVVATASVLVFWPWAGWRLHRHPWNLLREYSRDDKADVLYDLTHHLGEDNNANERLLQRLTLFVAVGCVGLATEVTCFLVDLGIRG